MTVNINYDGDCPETLGERVAILGYSRGNKSEVIRKSHPGRQHLLQLEYFLFRVKRILVPASFRSFDDHLHDLVIIGIPRRKT